MMDPDKELEQLEREFPRSRRAWARDTPIELDDWILSLAARHAPHLEARYKLKQELEKLGAGLEQGEEVIPPMDSRSRSVLSDEASYSEVTRFSKKLSTPMSQEAPPPPGAKKLLKILDGATREAWLNRVSSIVLLGDVELALYLLKEYRDRFPG